MEHILCAVACREPTKAGGTQGGFLEENPQPLTTIPPSAHFFIHMFNKHLLRAECGFCFLDKLAS